MKNRLDALPALSERALDSMEIPQPEEYRFFHDLLAVYPDLEKETASDPRQIHYLLAKLKAEGFFNHELEKEMKKELEKEKAALQKKRGESGGRPLPSRVISGRI